MLEPKTQSKIIKLFGNKVCTNCGGQAERYLDRKTYCQQCYLIVTLRSGRPGEREPNIREVPSIVYTEDEDTIVRSRHLN